MSRSSVLALWQGFSHTRSAAAKASQPGRGTRSWLRHAALGLVTVVLASSLTLLVVCGSQTPAAASPLWSSTHIEFHGGVIANLSCPSPSFCAAVDGRDVIQFDGSTWSAPDLVDIVVSSRPPNELDAVSCTSSSFCVAIDSLGAYTVYNGSTWTQMTPLPGAPEPEVGPVSCASPTFCVVLGGSAGALTFNGSTWTPSSIGGSLVDSVSCPSSSFCMAVDYFGHAMSYNGSTWTGPTLVDSTPLTQVSCPTTSFCAAIDAKGGTLTYHGSAWSTPTGSEAARKSSFDVSCSSPSFCLATSVTSFSTYDGSTWSTPTQIVRKDSLTALSCASSSFCVAGDRKGDALAYNSMACGFSITNSNPLPNAILGNPYFVPLRGCGGTAPYKFTKVGKLPLGLRMSASGLISGVVRRSGIYSFSVTMRDTGVPQSSAGSSFQLSVVG